MVRGFARDMGVSPGIVVGRLQHDGVVGKGQLNDLKVRYEPVA
jgi:HTH-type transcriptional regulator/antitoxin HigA